MRLHVTLKVPIFIPGCNASGKLPFHCLLVNMHQESITYHLFLNCSRGGSALGILNNTLMGCMSWYGGCISASSISVMPADQISACQKKKTYQLHQYIFQKGTNLYLMHKCKWWDLVYFQEKKQNQLGICFKPMKDTMVWKYNSYSQTSPQRPPWGQKIAAVVERWTL